MADKIRVLIADDHTIMRGGLRKLLETDGDIEVIAEAVDGVDAVMKSRTLRPPGRAPRHRARR